MNVRRWAPPLFWAGVILLLTSIPNPRIPHALASQDKLAHFVLYAGFGFLLARSLLQESARRWAALATLAIAFALAAADEWHQQFIPGRSMDIADWRADALGAALAVLAALLMYRPRHPIDEH